MACGASSASNTATITSAGVVARLGGNMFALAHHDENPLEAEREPAGRNALAEEHADQVVVAPAAAQAAGEVGHVDLHDRARVVRQPARQARIESDPIRRRCVPAARPTIARKVLERRLACGIERRSPRRTPRRLDSLRELAASSSACRPRRQLRAPAVRLRRRPARSCPACRQRRAPSPCSGSGTAARMSASTSAAGGDSAGS